ncbi:hypothetical protein QWY85_09155 [Neolewinella lacunae]|uniref:Uncharacterized protein n=1 Tax=Neolewinella lacunae TaxID=1517758 RepID=A0A923TAK1_9BACT|nr:hypothetical protein [Neolewinella lacunae]MBC6996611.1 hypothetical protein [Neolewinella lacunae]MDN3634825.1 hypothetical protein [Neolewinella lacunae]
MIKICTRILFTVSLFLSFFTCDPAKVIRFSNLSKQRLLLKIDHNTCPFIKEEVLLGADTTYLSFLSTVKGPELFLGIGTWADDELPIVKACIGTMLYKADSSIIQQNDFHCDLSISGFGGRIVTVEILEIGPNKAP